jgi:hypothetical protein
VLLLLVLLVVGMSLAGRAQAAEPRPTLKAKAAAFDPATGLYTGQRPANDPWLSAIMESGRSFWASRGVTIPDQIQVDVADDLRESDQDDWAPEARGWQDGSGRIALDARMTRRTLAQARSRRPTAKRRAALKVLAATLLHEMGGHTGGLPHVEDEGFMGARSGAGVVPEETARVIRRLVKRRPGEKLSGGMAGIG